MSNVVPFVDIQGLGGGFTLGTVQAGGELLHKAEQAGGFGIAQCDDNRQLLGYDWSYEDGIADSWEVIRAPLVIGNPPCSGFSMMSVRAGSGKNRGDKRGPNAAINSCMWDFAEYVQKAQPQIAIMESVATAGKDTKAGGRALMQELASFASQGKLRYDVYHVFHNGIGCGGSSVRSRYFLVMSSIPFGVQNEVLPEITPPHLKDVIGDLEKLPLRMAGQKAKRKPSEWAAQKFTGMITGHDITRETPHQGRAFPLAGDWKEGEPIEAVVQRIYEETGEFPPSWGEKVQQTVLYRPLKRAEDFDLVAAGKMTEDEYVEKWNAAFPKSRPIPWQSGAYSTKRWFWNRAGRVLTGGGLVDNIHPTQPRTFTYREGARIMGFPDDWSVDTYAPNSHNVFGKGVLVESGRWIADCAIQAINGNPYPFTGVETDQGDFIIDVSKDWKAVYNDRTGEYGDFRNKELIKEMENR